MSETSSIRSIMGGKSKKLIDVRTPQGDSFCALTARVGAARSRNYTFESAVILAHNNAKRKKIMFDRGEKGFELSDLCGLESIKGR